MKLAVMGDLHYHEIDEAIPGWAEARNDFYQTFLKHFFTTEADIHISLGDLTNYGYASELNEVYGIVKQYDTTFYHALGNHDLYAQTRKEVLEISGQARYHAVTTEQAVLVFLDTAKEMDFKDWGGWIDEEQLRWFEQVIQDSGTKPVLVFAHHPVHKTTTHSDRDKGSIHPDIDMWSILSQKQGIGIYFNGHTHIDSIVQQNNWTFVQLSACLDEHGLRIVDIGEEDIRITAIDIAEAALTDNAGTLYTHMKHFKPTADACGNDAERECTVSLRLATEQK